MKKFAIAALVFVAGVAVGQKVKIKADVEVK